MKIVVLEPAGYGAMARYAFQLARGLSNAGADVTLLTRDDYELVMLCAPFRLEQSVEYTTPRSAGGTPRSAVGTLRHIAHRIRHLREWRRILARLERLRPNAVILGELRSTTDYWALTRLRKITPIVAHISHREGPATPLWKRIYAKLSVVFVQSERARRSFVETFEVPADRVEVIARGNDDVFAELADPTFTAATLRRQLGIADEEPIVLFFGMLDERSGVDTLVRAFPAIRDRAGARLVLTGRPGRHFDLEAHMKLGESLGVGDSIVWVPEFIPGEHVKTWMELASVVVLPHRPGMDGGSIHVAQSFGVPAVVSDVDALTDLVEDGRTALVAPADDVNAIAGHVTRLLEDRALAQRIGAAFQHEGRTRFSWDEIGRSILARLRA